MVFRIDSGSFGEFLGVSRVAKTILGSYLLEITPAVQSSNLAKFLSKTFLADSPRTLPGILHENCP